MFGNIKTINKNSAIVELTIERKLMGDLLNMHVVFVDDDKKILGEVEDIGDTTAKINFLGEITDTNFIGGLIKKPTLEARVSH